MDIILIYYVLRFIVGIFKYNFVSILNLVGSGRCLVLIYFIFKVFYILLLFNIIMLDIYCIKINSFFRSYKIIMYIKNV